ncbi:MAG TPA: Flp pilus assembly protein CpaB [Actinomycetota bacterium]|nr:Flp pilus assembly protein CpaB [Actinomycetota bacterium]
MNKRSNGVVVGGIIVALVGMVLVFMYAGRVRAGAGVSGAAGTAFVATNDIPAGTRWEDMVGALKRREVPADVRPATAVTSTNQLEGRSAIRGIAKGEIVTTTQFNTSSSGGLDIPAGQNAVTINLGVPQAVARYIQPGSETNVYVTYKGLPTAGNPADAVVTKLLLSNVKVLANQPMRTPTEETAENAAPQGNEILLTLALNPQQAEQLIFAKENGSVWLGLVHPGDAPVTSGGRTFRTALV